MICCLSIYTSTPTTVSNKVKLPNSALAEVTRIGSVKINSHITHIHVLCIPPFNFNLLSVQQLAKSSNCCCLYSLTIILFRT